jgi:hypothetical protein
MEVDPRELLKGARASWWEDGLTEAVTGLSLLIIGLLGVLKDTSSGRAENILSFIYTFGLLTIIFSAQWIIRLLKRKLVWPWTGYAYPKRQRLDMRFAISFLILLLLLFSVFLLKTERLQGFLSGLFIFTFFSGLARYNGLKRFYIPSLAGLLSGIGFSLTGVTFPISFHLIFVIVGILMGATGIVVFSRFRRGAEVQDG